MKLFTQDRDGHVRKYAKKAGVIYENISNPVFRRKFSVASCSFVLRQNSPEKKGFVNDTRKKWVVF